MHVCTHNVNMHIHMGKKKGHLTLKCSFLTKFLGNSKTVGLVLLLAPFLDFLVLLCKFFSGVFVVVWDRVLLHSLSWPGTLQANQAGLKLADICLLGAAIKSMHHHAWCPKQIFIFPFKPDLSFKMFFSRQGLLISTLTHNPEISLHSLL